jgi:inner membrane protein
VASVISHSLAALALGFAFAKPREEPALFAAAAVCSVLPDLDVIGFRFAVRYGDFWGHRGFTHSLVFAMVLALAVLAAWFSAGRSPVERLKFGLYLFFSTASHSLLDAMTNGGLGVAWFSPFSTERYFLPWRPILVSPIGFSFFSRQGLLVLESEFFWIWLPSFVFAVLASCLGNRRRQA